MDDRYDGILMGILQNEGKLDRFLDAMFSFLCRRTDFYHILTHENQKMGFLPGISQKMVMNSYKKFESIHGQRFGTAGDVSKISSNKAEVKSGRSSKPKTEFHQKSNIKKEKTNPVTMPASESKVPENLQPQDTKVAAAKIDSSQDESSVQNYQAPPESYNGADRGTFSWSQTITDLDLRVQIPSHIKKAKDVKVKLMKKSITIELKKEEASDEFFQFLSDEFPWDINCEESMWSLLPKDGHIHVNIEKAKERWWDKALVKENGVIDVRKIDCSRPMSDLDDESQAKIQELMYNQRQKEKGLPTSEEQKMSAMLSKAWNAEGSPFKDQEFDPSRVKIGPDGSATIS